MMKIVHQRIHGGERPNQFKVPLTQGPSSVIKERKARVAARVHQEVAQCVREVLVSDTGCTGMMVPWDFLGRNLDTLLDRGTRRATDVTFSTADGSGNDMIPICAGSITVVMIDDEGRAWVIRLDNVYIFETTVCTQGFLSPAGLRHSWLRQGGQDRVALSCGSAAMSKLSLGWPETRIAGGTVTGDFGCTISDGTYYNTVCGLESLRTYKGTTAEVDVIIGDVAWAIMSLEHLCESIWKQAKCQRGTTAADWIAKKKATGMRPRPYPAGTEPRHPRAGQALLDAYETTRKKCQAWDRLRRKEDSLMMKWEQDAVCHVYLVPALHPYDWVSRRSYNDTQRSKELAKAKSREAKYLATHQKP